MCHPRKALPYASLLTVRSEEFRPQSGQVAAGEPEFRTRQRCKSPQEHLNPFGHSLAFNYNALRYSIPFCVIVESA
jgi:hypothetical protein